MRYARQTKILEIIKNEEISTQEELAERLKEEGFNATQATVSRDIKELGLVKVSGRIKKSRYADENENARGKRQGAVYLF